MIADFPYCEEDLYKGGVLQANYRLVEALARLDGLELYVLTPTTNVSCVQIRKEGNASIIFFPPVNAGFDTLLLYSGLQKSLGGLLEKMQPDLVHAQAVPAYILTALRMRFPHIVTLHGVYRNELKVLKSRMSLKMRLVTLIMRNVESYNFAKIQNLIAITSEIEALVKAHSPDVTVFRINNVIDERFFTLADENSGPIILFVGWVTYRKGVHLLFQAAEELIQVIPRLQVRIAGLENMDPEYGPSLRAKHANLLQSGHVRFLGAISQTQLDDELSKCSLLCLPSLADSVPMVIAEAMAAGKPVVATRIGGIPEMVEDGVTGRLCQPNDSDQLRICLMELLLNDRLRRDMGSRARQSAIQRYRAEAIARATYGAYLQVCLRS